MTKKQELRHLSEVSATEIRSAVVDMVKKLKLTGGSAGDYDLYAAVFREWEKARVARGVEK